MSQLPRYESYKESEVEWLGEIPSHWQVKRNIGIFDERKEINRPEMDLLSVTIKQGIIQQSEMTTKKDSSNEDKTKYKVVEKGDLAYNKMRMWQGAIGTSHYDGIVSPAYVILRPRDKSYSHYYHYLYRTPLFIKEANRHSYGLCDDMNSLRYEHFKTIYSPVPPPNDVEKITNFLDQKTAEIDEAIAKKEQLIALLQEQKAILINQAVTKGLNPNAPMKDSGSKWIGQVPKHWKVKRLKFIVKSIFDCKNRTPEYFNDGDYFVVRTSNVKDGLLRFAKGLYTDQKNFLEWTKKGLPKQGDILITREAPAGEVAIVPPDLALCLGQRMMNIIPNNEIVSNEFLLFFLQSESLKKYVDIESSGSTVSHLRVGQVYNIPVAYPPSQTEQKQVSTKCKRTISEIENIIDLIKLDHEKLTEYRATLIATVATGKVRV